MMGVDKPTWTTPLFIDMEIATEMLKRSHEEFLSLPRVEKKKLRLYMKVKFQKEEQSIRDRKMRTDLTGKVESG